jgi:endonuclease/exonuclease/phosphatase family metal-dependent hydrolase
MPQYEDEMRREYISGEVAASGADIVALEEVWGYDWQTWFAQTLKSESDYQYAAYEYSACDTYLPTGIDALSNGVLLLSKWPLSKVDFKRFPTFYPSCSVYDAGNPQCENWANKGVLTATVDVNGVPIRIGISHALLGPSDEKSDWSTNYIAKAITTFQLNGQAYIFALDKNNQAHIRRFEDYSYFDKASQTQKHGAGWKHVYAGTWGSDHIAVTSFELNGHPYLFGVNGRNEGHIEQINDDGRGWTNMKYSAWGSDHIAVTSFQLNGHPYLFGVNGRNEGHIERINDDGKGWTNMAYGAWGSDHIVVTSFQLNGHPYLFGVNGRNEGHIERINDDGKGWTCMNYSAWGSDHIAVTSFELNGHPYLFGVNGSNQGHIERINDDGKGWTTMKYGAWGSDHIAVTSFQLNGHPYLFALKNCCDQITCCWCWVPSQCDSCVRLWDPFASDPPKCEPCLRGFPGEAYLKRINDDPGTGWEGLYQLEDMKMIRDETVVDKDGPPVIMMGDFNVKATKYGIMDQLFRKTGAFDAYVEVHGTGEGGETVDWYNNKLMRIFYSEDAPARIDYVYFKPSGAGARLVPIDANVIRDWKYPSPSAGGDMDLSDHYPLVVKFRLEAGCEPQIRGDFDCDGMVKFSDLAILCSAWLSEPGSGVWDRACDISDPGDDFIGMKDFDAFARQWGGMLVHNVTENTWYVDIQPAINDANDSDEIEVGLGTYYEAIDFKGKAITLRSTDPNDPNVVAATIINGNGAYHAVTCVSGEGPDTILEGFTITGGNANGPEWPDDKNGGGLYCRFSSPTVVGCTFSGNTANYGGGMASRNAAPTVINCTFKSNSGEEGGGLYNIGWSPITLTNCTFISNSSEYGGGLQNDSSIAVLTNCLFIANTSTFVGGGMYNLGGIPTVTNCTFAGNSAASDGGGMDNYDSTPSVANCIFWGNTAATGSEIYGGSPSVTYSDIQGGWSGTGNINLDPLFVDAIGGNLRLSSGSPCIDKGSNAAVSGITTDLDGNPRVLDGESNGTDIVDMGAYEYLPGAPAAGSAANLEACCVLAAHWLEAPWPHQP